MLSADLRQKYLDFFIARGHKVVVPAPLVPENDSTTLFTSAGMQPLIPYLLGQPHPLGKRLVNSQPSFRAQDINEIGDNRHTTFFEMLGNWSLGDYFKKDQLAWIWEFLTKELKLPVEKLWVSVFAGEDKIPRDEESFNIWKKLGVPKEKIYFYNSQKNWWSRSGSPNQMPFGEPGGPDSEIFYDFGLDFHQKSPYKDKPCHPNCDCGRFMEIGNSVFLEYQKKEDGSLKELPQKNVDFGGGLERLLAVTNNDPDIFNTDLFKEIINKISEQTGCQYEGELKIPIRIVADHLKAATFMLHQGIEPSNKLQGYVLRRLLRRSAVKMYQLTRQTNSSQDFIAFVKKVIETYPEYLKDFSSKNFDLIENELSKFYKVLEKGYQLIEKTPPEKINGKFAFDLYQSYGFPYEVTEEILISKGICFLEKADFNKEIEKHRVSSRTAGKGIFKSGLADQSETTTRYHTATHLLHQVLRDVLGDSVNQSGSNITADRLRFDFSYSKALTEEELKQIETIINQKISANLPVTYKTMSLKKALTSKALANFKNSYPDRVTVYSIGNYSKEICAGPHVTATKQIGTIRIIKQESVGATVRRLYLKFS